MASLKTTRTTARRIVQPRHQALLHAADGWNRDDILIMAGAETARWRDDVDRMGLPGCRVPGGVFSFDVPAWPPAKSNSKALIVRRDTGSLGVALSAQVKRFMKTMAEAILAALDRLGHRLEWMWSPAGRSRPRTDASPRKPIVVNPLFGSDIEVDVDVLVYEPYRTNRDTDNILKVLLDVATLCGVFHDDVQVGDIHVCRRKFVGVRPDEMVRITLCQATPSASWSTNPNGRPVSSSVSDRWVQAGRFVPRSVRMSS